GRDDEATDILGEVVASMSEASPPTAGHPRAEDWGEGFDRYLAMGDRRIPTDLVEEARARWRDLCRSQAEARLLHGDLQHYNVLLDWGRGWLAIDPKGVVAEKAFELGAALRNPHGVPELYTPAALERRVGRLTGALGLEGERVVAWAFAQAVLSAVWTIEDEEERDPEGPALRVAEAARTLLD
ncbi:MAG: aminoglycoside phosphotransferase family protein, partial [Gemmatimonadota bacterium]